ncbi:paraneoplastic antigen Ma2-like [Aquarana catesbeiana]|uniref:paraneoplastic antigen Ma2-like n=1 Tax=Aquarana catesbeiana TaxID=8400 RepID=UPI003CCA0072
MSSAAATQWSQEFGGVTQKTTILRLPGDQWFDREVRLLMQKAVPGQGCYLLDIKQNVQENFTYALLERKEATPAEFQGGIVSLAEGLDGMVIQIQELEEQPPATPPGSPLARSSERDGTKSVSPGLEQNSEPKMPPASFYLDMSRLVDSSIQSHQMSMNEKYRKLPIFSGRIPRSEGEEDFESWVDQATQALEDWNVPGHLARRRISESLLSPAADVIRSLRRGKPDCGARDYLTALHAVYEKIENVPDLMHRFEHTHQKVGEKLSTYIVCIDQILHQIIMKKGVDPREADKVRLDRTLKGARPNHPIALRLLLKGADEVPSYPELMGLVREEEALLEEKNRETRMTRDPLQKSGRVAVQSASVEGMKDVDAEECWWEEHYSSLKEETLSAPTRPKSTEEEELPAKSLLQQALLRVMAAQAKSSSERVDSRRCYQCGDYGHIQARCPWKESDAALMKELLRMLKMLVKEQPAENFRGSQ